MVAAVPAQVTKILPRPPAACGYLLPTAHYPLSFCRPFVFLVLQIPFPACPTTPSFVFMYLQTPWRATPLSSHPYKTPGVSPLPATSVLRSQCLLGCGFSRRSPLPLCFHRLAASL